MKLHNASGAHLPRELLDRLAAVPPSEEYEGGSWRAVWWVKPNGEAIRAGQLGEERHADWTVSAYRRETSPEGWTGIEYLGSCCPWGDFERVARQVCKAWKDSQQMSLF